MSSEYKIGFIGLDTSHVVRFAEILNDSGQPNHLAGARVVAGYPGASRDFELSHSRVDGFTHELSSKYGVEIVSSPGAVAERSDLVFITSVDGRAHLPFFESIVRFGKPVFVDKPFATSVADAEAILRRACEAGIPVMSCSSLRYADNLRAAIADATNGAIVGCDAFGPMAMEPTQPGLFWYGIHTVEMLITVMGLGCRRVKVTTTPDADVVVAEWSDGRLATIHGVRQAHDRFGITIHRQKGFQLVDARASARPYYLSMLEAILKSLPGGRSDIPPEEIMAVIRFIEAANESRVSGRWVELAV